MPRRIDEQILSRRMVQTLSESVVKRARFDNARFAPLVNKLTKPRRQDGMGMRDRKAIEAIQKYLTDPKVKNWMRNTKGLSLGSMADNVYDMIDDFFDDPKFREESRGAMKDAADRMLSESLVMHRDKPKGTGERKSIFHNFLGAIEESMQSPAPMDEENSAFTTPSVVPSGNNEQARYVYGKALKQPRTKTDMFTNEEEEAIRWLMYEGPQLPHDAKDNAEALIFLINNPAAGANLPPKYKKVVADLRKAMDNNFRDKAAFMKAVSDVMRKAANSGDFGEDRDDFDAESFEEEARSFLDPSTVHSPGMERSRYVYGKALKKSKIRTDMFTNEDEDEDDPANMDEDKFSYKRHTRHGRDKATLRGEIAYLKRMKADPYWQDGTALDISEKGNLRKRLKEAEAELAHVMRHGDYDKDALSKMRNTQWWIDESIDDFEVSEANHKRKDTRSKRKRRAKTDHGEYGFRSGHGKTKFDARGRVDSRDPNVVQDDVEFVEGRSRPGKGVKKKLTKGRGNLGPRTRQGHSKNKFDARRQDGHGAGHEVEMDEGWHRQEGDRKRGKGSGRMPHWGSPKKKRDERRGGEKGRMGESRGDAFTKSYVVTSEKPMKSKYVYGRNAMINRSKITTDMFTNEGIRTLDDLAHVMEGGAYGPDDGPAVSDSGEGQYKSVKGAGEGPYGKKKIKRIGKIKMGNPRRDYEGQGAERDEERSLADMFDRRLHEGWRSK